LTSRTKRRRRGNRTHELPTQVTGETRMEQPPAPWEIQESRHRKGVHFYFNPETGCSCFEKPDLPDLD